MDTEYIITDDAFAEDRDTFEIEQDAPKKSSRKQVLLVLALFSIFILLLLAFGASQISGVSTVPNNSTIQDTFTIPDNSTIRDNTHWRQISTFNLSSSLAVEKFRSGLTGLTVVLARAESPIVSGYFCLATEAQDDDGLPHTLEHLVFLGSEDYPYKEVLDLLANRCLADRTNAWTAVDHTCYTTATAGPSGFLEILPVYLDHILHPTLRARDFITEVHHVDEEGEDAGVVYSEMQDVEEKRSDIMNLALSSQLYPESGYARETGGKLSNLRNSTNIAKVRRYHQQFYRPENLRLTIIGQIEEQELFKVLRRTEEKILRKRTAKAEPKFQRPWHKPIRKLNLTKDLQVSVDFPSEDETNGFVTLAWRLPHQLGDTIQMLGAYNLLLKYLTDTQVSPFVAEFVQCADPLATGVFADTNDYKEPSLEIQFLNVPTARLTEVVPRTEKVLRRIISDGPDNFDIERIRNYVDEEMTSNHKDMENSPNMFVPDASVLDMLYGNAPEHLKQFATSSQLNEKYKDNSGKCWLNLMKDLLVKNPKVVMIGRPSKKLDRNLTDAEASRIEKQVKDLGPDGLAEKERVLEESINSQKTPGTDVLQRVPLANVSSIPFRYIKSYNRTHNKNKLFDFSLVPFKIQIDDVKSKFVQINIVLDTTVLNRKQKMFLPLLRQLWLTSPVMKNDQEITVDKMVKRRTKTLLNLDMTLGLSGSAFSPVPFQDALIIKAQAEISKLTEAVAYLGDAINYPHLTSKKVHSTATNLLNKIPSLKLSAVDVLGYLFDGLYFSKDSNVHLTSILRQEKFLNTTLSTMKSNPELIISELYNTIAKLARPETAFVYLATDAQDLRKIHGSFLPFLNMLFNSSNSPLATSSLMTRYKVKADYSYKIDPDRRIPQHLAMGLAGTDSCFLKQMMPFNTTDWTPKEAASLSVMLGYLSDRLYDEVRGPGLTYGVRMGISPTSGRMTLTLDRSSRLAEAYRTTRQLLTRFSTGGDAWDKTLLDSAKGSQIFSKTSRENTVEDLVNQAFKSYLRGTDATYNREFVKALVGVQLEDMKALSHGLLSTFLSPETSQIVVVCSPNTVKEIVTDFQNMGFQMKTYTHLDETFLNEDI